MKLPFEKETWREQFARVERWYQKTQKISRTRVAVDTEDLDILFAFFLNCWHLYDWLKNSEALPAETIEDFFRKNDHMKFCYDICIGTKHLKIDNPKAGLNRLVMGREYVGGKIGYVSTQMILFKGGGRRMTLMADNCMSEIKSFLRESKLL